MTLLLPRIFAIAVAFLAFVSCEKQDDQSLEFKLEEVLKSNFTEAYADQFAGKPAGVFLAIKNADTSLFVQHNLDGVMTESTHFKGASTTKTFTSAAILWLHQEGELDIDDKLTDLIPGKTISYLPQTPDYDVPYKSEITIRQLLNHRAGVFDVTNSKIPDSINAPYAGMIYPDYLKDQFGETYTFTFDALVFPVVEHQLSYFPPGTGMHYSNTGYNLLGKIVERVSGLSLSAFKKQFLLDPLELNDTHFEDVGTNIHLPAPFIDSYLLLDGQVIDITEDNLSSAIAEGNIVTTPSDIAEWAWYLYGTNSILNTSMQNMMTEPLETGEHHVLYGLGTQMYPEEIGVGHNGARAAFMTIMRYHPPTQTSYVVSSNTLNVDDFEQEGEMLNQILRDAIEVMK